MMRDDIPFITFVVIITPIICLHILNTEYEYQHEKKERRTRRLERVEQNRKLRVLERERRENAAIVIQRAYQIRRYIKRIQCRRAWCILPDRMTLEKTCENLRRGKTGSGTRTIIVNGRRFQVEHPNIDGARTGARSCIVHFSEDLIINEM